MVLSKLIVKKLSFTTFHTIFLVCVIVQYVANVLEDDISATVRSHIIPNFHVSQIVIFCCVSLQLSEHGLVQMRLEK